MKEYGENDTIVLLKKHLERIVTINKSNIEAIPIQRPEYVKKAIVRIEKADKKQHLTR